MDTNKENEMGRMVQIDLGGFLFFVAMFLLLLSKLGFTLHQRDQLFEDYRRALEKPETERIQGLIVRMQEEFDHGTYVMGSRILIHKELLEKSRYFHSRFFLIAYREIWDLLEEYGMNPRLEKHGNYWMCITYDCWRRSSVSR